MSEKYEVGGRPLEIIQRFARLVENAAGGAQIASCSNDFALCMMLVSEDEIMDALDRGATIVIREKNGKEKLWHPVLEEIGKPNLRIVK